MEFLFFAAGRPVQSVTREGGYILLPQEFLSSRFDGFQICQVDLEPNPFLPRLSLEVLDRFLRSLLTPGGKVNFCIVGEKRLQSETIVLRASVVRELLCKPSLFPFRYLPKPVN